MIYKVYKREPSYFIIIPFKKKDCRVSFNTFYEVIIVMSMNVVCVFLSDTVQD